MTRRTREDLIRDLPDSFSNVIRRPLSYYVPKPKKESIAMEKNPDRFHRQDEESVVTECITWMKKNGWVCKKVYTGGVPVGNGKLKENPAAGIFDYICFHVEHQRMVWIEFKRSHGGRISEDQMKWFKWLTTCKQEAYFIHSLVQLKNKIDSKE